MTEQAVDTRTRLLGVTSELIWSGSFHATGVHEICRRADVRKGSFYHFFPSKTDLAVEALLANWEQVRSDVFDAVFSREEKGMARLRVLIGEVDRLQQREFESRGVYLGCPFGSLGQEMAHQEPHLRTAVDEVFEGHADYFERALQEAMDSGEIPEGDLRGRARSLLAMMEGALLLAKVANRPERFREIMDPLLDRFVSAG